MDESKDDFFGEECAGNPGDEQERGMSERELASRRKRLVNEGYRLGVDEGIEVTLQDGFDEGYALGAGRGWEIGTLYGAAAAVAAATRVKKDAACAGEGSSAKQTSVQGGGEDVKEGTGVGATAAVGGTSSSGSGSDDAQGGGFRLSGQAAPVVEGGEARAGDMAAGEVLASLQAFTGKLKAASLAEPDPAALRSLKAETQAVLRSFEQGASVAAALEERMGADALPAPL